MEWGKKEGRGFSASWLQLGVPIGLVLATGVVRITTGFTGIDGFDSYGWRIPFLISIVLIGVGLYVRLRVVESPEFAAPRKTGKVVAAPLVEVIKRHPEEILLAALVRMSEQAPFYLFITFVLSYGTKQLKLNSNTLLNDTLIAAAIGLISTPLFGWLSDKLGRRRVYGTGVVLTALFGLPVLRPAQHPLHRIGAARDHRQPHRPRYSVRAAGRVDAESFDADVRYTGAGLGYQLASVIAGGPAPLIAAALLTHYGSSTTISLYIIGCAVLSMIALVALPRTAQARYANAVDPLAEPTEAAA